jgi:hypothetical protein
LRSFILDLHIDNTPCEVGVDPAQLTGPANACGVLPYDLTNPSAIVTMPFTAVHDNWFATYSFSLKRGVTGLPGPPSYGSADPLVHPRAPTSGTLVQTASIATLTAAYAAQGLPQCDMAAFSESVRVWAMATNGWQRLSGLDAFDHGAFVLSPEPGTPGRWPGAEEVMAGLRRVCPRPCTSDLETFGRGVHLPVSRFARNLVQGSLCWADPHHDFGPAMGAKNMAHAEPMATRPTIPAYSPRSMQGLPQCLHRVERRPRVRALRYKPNELDPRLFVLCEATVVREPDTIDRADTHFPPPPHGTARPAGQDRIRVAGGVTQLLKPGHLVAGRYGAKDFLDGQSTFSAAASAGTRPNGASPASRSWPSRSSSPTGVW